MHGTRVAILSLLLLACTVPSFAGLNRWTSSGPEGASITALAADTNDPRIVYAGTSMSGVFRSVSAADPDWQPFNDGLADLVITALAIDSTVPRIVYAGTLNGRIFRSVNDGPWSEVAKPPSGVVSEFAVDRQRGNVYAAAMQAGVLVSRDNGQSWTVVPGLQGDASDVTLTPDTTLYASIASAEKTYFSIDGGVTWNVTGTEFPWATVADSESTIYGIFNATVVQSTDYGRTWKSLPALVQMPVRLFPRARGVYASTQYGSFVYDVGDTAWRNVDALWSRVDAMAYGPARLYAGTTAGVFAGTANGTEWRAANRGLNVPVVFDVASSGVNRAYAATNGGLFRTDDGGGRWRKVLDEPVTDVETDGADLVKASFRGVRSSADGGETWEVVAPRLSGGLAITNSTPATLYAAFAEGISKSLDGGRTWGVVSNGLSYPASWWYYGIESVELETDRSDPAAAYVAYDIGLFKTTDSGQQWTRILGESGRFNDIPAVTARGQVIHAAQGTGIRTSLDGGRTWSAPQLTDERITAITVDRSDPARSYAGTATGWVYRSDDFGSSWVLFSDGLQSARVFRIDTNDNGNRIYAATHSGLYEYQIGATFPVERLPDDPLRLPALMRGVPNTATSRAAFLLPAVGTVRGFGGTTFRTDVTLSNDREADQSVLLVFLPQANGSGATVPTFRVTLPPASGDSPGTLSVSDIADALGLDGFGALLVFATDSAGKVIPSASIDGFARVRSTSSCGPGSVSQSVAAVSPQAFAAHARGRALGLRHDAGHRTNVGIVNLDDAPRAFTIVVDGQRDAQRFTIVVPAFAPLQVPVANRDYGAVTLTIISAGDGPWAAYGSSVDNNSSDGWTSQVLPLP
jgi:photosystem II stability/assembly factor-like uncharacterized protein